MASGQGMLGRLRNWAFGEKSEGAAPFDQVLTAELEEIEQSRRQRGQPPLATDTSNPVSRARESGLMGLSLSGGGIRSATFCLGVIQALAAADLLGRFDYLSTVSGGGFIGGWLTAWIKRSKDGVLQVQRVLKQAVSGSKAPPIEFLRDYSNYLAPRTGLFSTDTWTIGTVWLRNTVLNQAVIMLFFAGCMLAPRLFGLLLPWVARFPLPAWIPYREYAPALPGIAAAVLLLVAAGRVAGNLLWFQQREDSKARKDFQPGVIRIGLMLLAACWLGAASLWQAIDHPVTPWAVAIVFAAGVFYLGKKRGPSAASPVRRGRVLPRPAARPADPSIPRPASVAPPRPPRAWPGASSRSCALASAAARSRWACSSRKRPASAFDQLALPLRGLPIGLLLRSALEKIQTGARVGSVEAVGVAIEKVAQRIPHRPASESEPRSSDRCPPG